MPLPPWATNMQMMSPLLFAYEERIAELEAVVERSVSLAEQAQVLTKENDTLRVELHDRTEQLRNSQVLAPIRDSPSADQQDEIHELYRLSVEQNEALAQQNQLLKLQIERMQQSLVAAQQQMREVQSRAAEGSKAFATEQERTTKVFSSEQERWAKALAAEQERVASEQQRAEVLARQRGAAEQRLDEVTGELVEEVRTREQLETQLESLRHEHQLQRQSLDMYRKSIDDRCALAQDEEERMRADFERVSRSDKEQRQRVADLEQQLMEASSQLYAARRDGDAAKKEAEEMLPFMCSMERRLKDISERHDLMQAKLSDQENQVSDLLMEKDFLATSEHACHRQAERLEVRLQAEAEALKQRTPTQEVDALRDKHMRYASEMEEKLRRSELASSELRTQVDLSEKQRAWEASAVERQNSVYAAERDRWQGDLDEAQQVRLRLERNIDSTQHEAKRLKSELEAAALESKELLCKVNAELASTRTRCQGAERQVDRLREEVRTSEASASNVATERTRAQAELKEERSRASEALEGDRRRAAAERRGLERQLQALQARAQQEEHRAVELLRAQESLRLRWQAELGLEKDSLEAQVERLSKENRAIRERSRGVLKALAMRRVAGEDVRVPSLTAPLQD
mmetsp:Transcript_105376/g.339879  ORF Transcript_105376/g.339879 Transcript_105376/m.339879 type:complete len:634 (-) Transcript_105376:62-1963(-)